MADKLTETAEAEAGVMRWDGVAKQVRDGVTYTLRNWRAGHEKWRNASPEDIAEAVTVYVMAGVAPVLSSEQVTNGVALIRSVLERAGIDPKSLPWV